MRNRFVRLAQFQISDMLGIEPPANESLVDLYIAAVDPGSELQFS